MRAMPRPKNQAERRAHLINAATRAVIKRGSTGTKLRDIAEAAELTPASVLYYYPDVQDLYAAVLERGITTYCEHREQEIAAVQGPVEQLRACIRSGVPWPGEAEQNTRLLFELFPVVLRNEAAAEQDRVFVARQAELYRDVLQRGADGGDFALAGAAPALARSFVALEDGYAIELMIGAATAEEIEARLLAHARLVTGNSAFRTGS